MFLNRNYFIFLPYRLALYKSLMFYPPNGQKNRKLHARKEKEMFPVCLLFPSVYDII